MPLPDDLVDLAKQLTGDHWKEKTIDRWTDEDRAAYAAASDDEQHAYLEWVLDQPIEIPELPQQDPAFLQEMEEGGRGTH